MGIQVFRSTAVLVTLAGVGAAALLTACGGSSGSTAAGGTANAGTISDSASDLFGGAIPSSSGSSKAGAKHAAAIDVCGLFTQDDATAVARAQGLGGDNAATIKYTLRAEPVAHSGVIEDGSHGCTFSYDGSDADGSPATSVTIEIMVKSADGFSIYSTDASKVPGLGDEAYNGQGSTVVRVGDVMLAAGENSAGDDFAVAMFRKMIPRIS